jgi:hypothetical protein
MSVAQFNVATTFLLSQAYQHHPEPIHLSPAEFLVSIENLTHTNAEEWHKVFIHTATWLRDENYLAIGSIDMGNTLHALRLTEKGLRLLISPSSLEKIECPDWGDALLETAEKSDFNGWKEMGKALIQEGSKMGFRALVGSIIPLP